MSPPLPRLRNLRMHNPHMPRQRIIPRKRLLLPTVLAPHLPLCIVVDRILMPGQIVRSAKDRIAGLACARIFACALVRAGLGVAG